MTAGNSPMTAVRGVMGAVALGALLALGLFIAVGIVGSPAPSAADRAASLAAELRCPDCAGLSVADSPTRSADEIRRQIDALVVDGLTDDAIRQHFVDRYGEWILLAPRSPIVWLLPAMALVAGVVLLVSWLRPRPRSDAQAPLDAPLPTTERRRVHDEAEALDA